MLKYALSIFVTATLSFIFGLYLPWWSIALAGLISSGIIPQKPLFAFLSGFIGVFLLWEILAWVIDNKNNGIMSQKMAHLLPLGGSTVLLILITSIVGGLVAGLAAVTGTYLRRLIFPNQIVTQ